MGGAALVAPRKPWGTKVWRLKELVGVPELQMVRAGIGAGRHVNTGCLPPRRAVYEHGVPT